MTRIPIHIVWERGVKLPENKLNNKELEDRIEYLQDVISELQIKLEEIKVLLMKEKNNNEVD